MRNLTQKLIDMTQEEFDSANLLDQVLYDCTGMLVENHPSIAKAMQKYADKQLLIYSVVGSLPTEDERDSEKDRVRDIILKEITDLDRVSFGAGFRACFSWLTKRYTK